MTSWIEHRVSEHSINKKSMNIAAEVRKAKTVDSSERTNPYMLRTRDFLGPNIALLF